MTRALAVGAHIHVVRDGVKILDLTLGEAAQIQKDRRVDPAVRAALRHPTNPTRRTR